MPEGGIPLVTFIMDSAETLRAEIATHIHNSDAQRFEALALRIFAYQFASNKRYRMFCEGRNATPDTVTAWRDIPAAPAAAFKQFALTCVSAHQCTPEHGGQTFHSSGTTGAETSKHYMDANTLQLYRQSLHTSFRHFVLTGEESGECVPYFLMPPPADAPHSSLSYMAANLDLLPWDNFWWRDGWREELIEQLDGTDTISVLFGTAFAWVQLMDFMEEKCVSLALPAGSRIVETGGFKGRSREVERGELYRMFTERLGVPATHCVAEYGMSEMASQFYDTTYRDRVLGVTREPRKMGLPHLVRTRVIDPVTGEEAERGQPGVLAHYDIANLNSCLAIQTEDWGYAHSDGDGFALLGRAPGAALRGCSLTAEEFAARQAVR